MEGLGHLREKIIRKQALSHSYMQMSNMWNVTAFTVFYQKSYNARNGDDNENNKKLSRFISKTITLHVQHTLFYISLSLLLHDNNV